MDDLISRRAALHSFQEVCCNVKCCECKATDEDGTCKLERWIKELPSAERHGRWIKKYRGNYLCSVCGAWYRTTDDYGNIIDGEMTANYCESCGAKMDEVEE